MVETMYERDQAGLNRKGLKLVKCPDTKQCQRPETGPEQKLFLPQERVDQVPASCLPYWVSPSDRFALLLAGVAPRGSVRLTVLVLGDMQTEAAAS